MTVIGRQLAIQPKFREAKLVILCVGTKFDYRVFSPFWQDWEKMAGNEVLVEGFGLKCWMTAFAWLIFLTDPFFVRSWLLEGKSPFLLHPFLAEGCKFERFYYALDTLYIRFIYALYTLVLYCVLYCLILKKLYRWVNKSWISYTAC